MLSLILLLLQALQMLIIVDALLSWVKPDKHEFPRNITSQVTEPLYAPIRAIINPQAMGGFDISPILVLVLIHVVQSALLQ